MRLGVFAEMEIIGAAGGASPVYVALAVTAVDFAGASVKLQENKRGRGGSLLRFLSGYLLCKMCFDFC